MLRNLLSSAGLGRLASEATQLRGLAHLDAPTLKLLDKELIAAADAAKGGVLSKVNQGYYKLRKPVMLPYNAIYGGGLGNMGGSGLAASLAGSFGLVNYGGKLAAPGLGMFSSIANKITPAMAKAYSIAPGNTIHMLKPATALAAKPLMALGMSNPVYAAAALPFALAGAYKGGRGIVRRMGQAQRLNQLRRGIAPSIYKQQALQLGLK